MAIDCLLRAGLQRGWVVLGLGGTIEAAPFFGGEFPYLGGKAAGDVFVCSCLVRHGFP